MVKPKVRKEGISPAGGTITTHTEAAPHEGDGKMATSDWNGKIKPTFPLSQVDGLQQHMVLNDSHFFSLFYVQDNSTCRVLFLFCLSLNNPESSYKVKTCLSMLPFQLLCKFQWVCNKRVFITAEMEVNPVHGCVSNHIVMLICWNVCFWILVAPEYSDMKQCKHGSNCLDESWC